MDVQGLLDWCKANTYITDKPDADWIDLFRAARADLVGVVRVQKTSTTDLALDVPGYELPTNFKEAQIVRLSADGVAYTTIDRIPVENFDDTGYKIWGKEIIIQPTPDASVTSGLQMYYWAYPDELTGTTTQVIDLPNPYLYGYYALAAAALEGREMTVENRHYQEYIKLRSEFSQMENVKEPGLKMEVIS